MAETNIKETLKASAFSLKEKQDFYKKKWLKDHIAIMVFFGIWIIGVLVAGIVCKNFEKKVWNSLLNDLYFLGFMICAFEYVCMKSGLLFENG